MIENTIDALNQRQQAADAAQLPKPADNDMFGACFDMLSAMQTMMFACFAGQTETVAPTYNAITSAGDRTAPQPITFDQPARAASQPQHVTTWPETAPRSWYRRPVETPFGSYMHGSGMFVPGGMLTGFVEACWQPQAEMAMRMAGQSPGLNPFSTGPFGFGAMSSMVPMAGMQAQPWMAPPWATLAMLPGWNSYSAATSPFGAPTARHTSENFEMPAQAALAMWSEAAGSMVAALSAMLGPLASEPSPKAPVLVAEPVAASPRVTEASYRTSGGHAAATVVATKHAPLMPATLPMALGLSGLLMFAQMATAVGPGIA